MENHQQHAACETCAGRRRWLQFRLRTLLILLVMLCVSLGSWHLYFVYFGPYVEAGPAVVGRPLTVRGRFMDFFGSESAAYYVRISKRQPDGQPLVVATAGTTANRRGLSCYDVEVELPPIYEAGEYDITLLALTRSVLDRSKSLNVGTAFSDLDSARGKMNIVEKTDSPKSQ